jgi:hypothetical protein
MKSENTKNKAKGMRVKSSIKAGDDCQDGYSLMGKCHNHNQTVVREAKSLRVKSNVKAGVLGCSNNHNQAVRRESKSLRVKSSVKAGEVQMESRKF